MVILAHFAEIWFYELGAGNYTHRKTLKHRREAYTMQPLKHFRGLLEPRTHACLKAEAVLNGLTIPNYIIKLIEEDLLEKGYNLDETQETPRQFAAAE